MQDEARLEDRGEEDAEKFIGKLAGAEVILDTCISIVGEVGGVGWIKL